MKQNEIRKSGLTVVLTSGTKRSKSWRVLEALRKVVTFDEADLLGAFLSLVDSEGNDEIARVIVDKTIDERGLAGFVRSLPKGFGGEVLCIQSSGSGLLSVPAESGRRVSELGFRDVLSYLNDSVGLGAASGRAA